MSQPTNQSPLRVLRPSSIVMETPAHDGHKADEFLSDVHMGCPPGNGLLRSRFLVQQTPVDTPVSAVITLVEIEVEEEFSPGTASDGDLEVRRRPQAR